MKTSPLLIAAILSFPSLTFGMEDVVKVLKSEPSSKEESVDQKQTFTISSPDVKFDIDAVSAKDGISEVGDPSVAPLFINSIFNAPSLSFNVTAPGFTLARKPFTVEVLKGDSEKKGIQVIWDLPLGRAELLLVLNDTDHMLYGRLRFEAPGRIRIGWNLAPGGYTIDSESRDRWVHTSASGDQPHGDEVLPMQKADWLLLYDTLLDPEISKGKGAAGFLWKVDDDAKVEFRCRDYVSSWSMDLEVNGDTREMFFAFRPFEGIPNEAAKEIISQEAEATLRKLTEDADTLFAFPSNP